MRRFELFICQHGKILILCLVLCVTCSMLSAHSASALTGKDIEELRREIREFRLLEKQRAVSEPGGNATFPAASSESGVASGVTGENGTADSAAKSIEPLPAIDTSPVSHSSLAIPALDTMVTARTASVVNPAASSSSSAAIETSASGWRIGGGAWYLWLSPLLVLIAGAYWYWKRYMAVADARQ